MRLPALLSLAMCAVAVRAADIYVATNGTANGSGAIGDPLSLTEAFRTNYVNRLADNANYLAWSEDLTPNGTWGIYGIASRTATSVTEDTSNGNHFIRQPISTVTNGSWRVSWKVKPNGRNRVRIDLQEQTGAANFGATFNLVTRTIAATFSYSGALYSSGTCTDAGDGWSLCTIIGTTSGGSANYQPVAYLDNGTDTAYTGDGTSGLYLTEASVKPSALTATYVGTATQPIYQGTPGPAVPGGTIWIRGGTYTGCYTNYLTGTNGLPITVRPYTGEHVKLDSAGADSTTLALFGQWVDVRDLEICNSGTDRAPVRRYGVDMAGQNCRLINCQIHDAGNGVMFRSFATNSTVYGCLIYNNGWQGEIPDRGHGHGIYTQSDEPNHGIYENVVLNQFGYGIHYYAEGGQLLGCRIGGNVAFNNGSLAREGTREANYLIGGTVPVYDTIVTNNFSYHAPSFSDMRNFSMGYGTVLTDPFHNHDFTATGNYLVGGLLGIGDWLNFTFKTNTFYGASVRYWAITSESLAWDNNTYYLTGATPFRLDDVDKSFADWKSLTSFDAASTVTASAPVTSAIFVRTNAFQAGRAHVIVYNWADDDNVTVDLSGILSNGQRYVLRNAQDYFAAPVLSNTYSGAISIPLTNLTVATPAGLTAPASTLPEFGVFVVVPGEVATPPTGIYIKSVHFNQLRGNP